jgi:toxin secretion/phage lysis holin
MKNAIITTIGVIGSFIAFLFGGWTASLTTLLIFMGIDYLSGIVLAGVFHQSPKTATGTLESRTGFKGLIRKGMILLFVWVGYRLDLTVGTTYIKDAVCIAFIANELLSIVENAGLMGIPIPAVITNAIDILKKKEITDKTA